jgi:hypothetical protein
LFLLRWVWFLLRQVLVVVALDLDFVALDLETRRGFMLGSHPLRAWLIP